MGSKFFSAISLTNLIASRLRSQSFEILHQRFMLNVVIVYNCQTIFGIKDRGPKFQ